MPAKDRMNITMTPRSRSDLARLHELARAQGVDLTYTRTKGSIEVSDSAAVHWAMRLVASGSAGVSPAQTPKPRDGDRLRAVMRGLTARQVSDAAGCSFSHVRSVLSGSVPLSPRGALHAWVEARERG